jgi:hypothetical protein
MSPFLSAGDAGMGSELFPQVEVGAFVEEVEVGVSE